MAGSKAMDSDKPCELNARGYRQSTRETFLDIFGERFDNIFGGRIAGISRIETSFSSGTGADDIVNAVPEGVSTVSRPKHGAKR